MALEGATFVNSGDEVTHLAVDNDGDGTYDDVVSANVIGNNSDYATIATDDDGDGFFDDVHFVHVVGGIPNTQPHATNASQQEPVSTYTGRPESISISRKGLKRLLIVLAALSAFGMLSQAALFLWAWITTLLK